MTKITYSTETLYHFNCHSCGGWWSVGDAPTLPFWTCPRCGFTAIAKPVETDPPSVRLVSKGEPTEADIEHARKLADEAWIAIRGRV